jgi:hypothetical protein
VPVVTILINKTSTVPLVVVFTKFDGQIIEKKKLANWVIWMIQLSGTKLEKMLKSLFREFISLKSLIPSILQKHMCAWKVEIISIAISWQRYRQHF